MVSQELLASALGDRLARAGLDPIEIDRLGRAGLDPPGIDRRPAEEAGAAADPAPDGPSAAVVMRRFDAPGIGGSALRFAAELDPARRQPWLRAFTRTVFLAGNPANLRRRFAFTQVAPDQSIAWCGPGPAEELTGLRRMLKLFPAGRLSLPAEVPLRVPGAGRGDLRRLDVATAGLTTASYLVHVNHALAEAVLTDLLRPGDRVVLRHVPDLDEPALRAAAAIRVHRDLADPALLRAYACLSPRLPGA
jgi:hypothetical protein